jgi:anthranilate phosphoribosyltransferase
MTFPLIDRVEAGRVLERAEAEAAMEELVSGRVETGEIVRLLAALNRRGHVRDRRRRFEHV